VITNLLRKAVVPLSGVAAVVLVVLLATPRAVHAVVAALVQVVNTSANPVPNADVNAPGEEPFQTILCQAAGTATCFEPDSFAVPATTSDGLTVKRLVVEYVSAHCQQSGVAGLTPILQALMNENPVNSTVYPGTIYIPLTPSPGAASTIFNSSVAARAYADPGTTVGVGIIGTVGSGGGAVCRFDVDGYFVTH
jgi:hypothetical protein